MLCARCQGQNEENAKFCIHCGTLLAPACPKCGQAVAIGAMFCTACGTALQGAGAPPKKRKRAAPEPTAAPAVEPPAPAPAQPSTPEVVPAKPRRSRRLVWLLAVVALLCTLAYWSMLVPVPLLPADSPIAGPAQRARILQENLPRPAEVEQLPVTIGLNEPDPPVQVVGAGEAMQVNLAPACSKDTTLEVAGVSEGHVFTFAESFGNGPMTYSLKATRGSLKAGKNGFHAQWTVYKDGKSEVVRDNHWYACDWDEKAVNCSGPNWREYDAAELCIYSGNPACQMPLQCFPFEGQGPLPQPQADLCETPASFHLQGVSDDFIRAPVWRFRTGGVAVPENKYLLVTEGGSDHAVFCTPASGPSMDCNGPPLSSGDAQGLIRWSLYQVPIQACPQPVASGTVAGTPAAQTGYVPPRQVGNYTSPPEDMVAFFCNEPGAIGRIKSIPGDVWAVDVRTGGVSNMHLDECDKLSCSEYFCTDGLYSRAACTVFCGEQLPNAKCGLDRPCPAGEWCFNGICKPRQEAPECIEEWDEGRGNPGQCTYVTENGCPFELPYRRCVNNRWVCEENAVCFDSNPLYKLDGGSRCDHFAGLDMEVVYLDWQPGSALSFYFRIPGGVPGLEKSISGDNGAWEYRARIGEYQSSACSYQGYKERLYCSISLPADYSNAVRPMTLSVSGCEVPVFTDQTAYLPAVEGSSAQGSSQSGGSQSSGGSGSSSSCGVAPVCDPGNPGAWMDWCSCTGGTPVEGCLCVH